MHTKLLALALVLPNVLVLGGAFTAKAERPKQNASRRDSGILLASTSNVVLRANASKLRSRAGAAELRKQNRLVNLLMNREDRAISNQRRSLGELRQLLRRNPQVEGSIPTFISAAQRRINSLTLSIQMRERRMIARFFRIDRMLSWIRQLAPQSAALQALLRRQDGQSDSIEAVGEFQSRLAVESLPDTPSFPTGKPPASPIQA